MKSCLVVDDSEIVRKVARHIFESLKFETREAENGQAALDQCQAGEMPDAILLDWHMPALGSVEFLTSLRGLPGGDKPTVIYCATENSTRDIALALTVGADDYILKPFDRETIRNKLVAAGLL
jgi:two-component system chemotaxis response regulator CheY